MPLLLLPPSSAGTGGPQTATASGAALDATVSVSGINVAAQTATATATAINVSSATPTTFSWSGYTWSRLDAVSQPGPNTFEADLVTVNDAGQLILEITDRLGGWKCAQAQGPHLGYGKYSWKISSAVHDYDRNLVLGLFIYDNSAPPFFREIDFEISQFGVAGSERGWLQLQPGGANKQFWFNPREAAPNTFEFTWAPGKIRWEARDANNRVIETFLCTTDVPTPGTTTPVLMNFWLFGGNAPTDGRSRTVIFDSFTFTPSAAVADRAPTAHLTDLFSYGSLTSVAIPAATGRWNNNFGTPAPTIANGRGKLTLASGAAAYTGIGSGPQSDVKRQFDLTASEMSMEWITFPNVGNGTTEAILELKIDPDTNQNTIGIIKRANQLVTRWVSGGVANETYTDFDAFQMRWWRVREVGGTVFWETSPNGSNWDIRRSATTPITITALFPYIIAGHFGSESSPGIAEFDNVNSTEFVAATVIVTAVPMATIEVAFDTQPMSTTPIWTDITPYVDPPIIITRGRTDEFSRVQPATMSMTLDNSDGRFTRGLTTSPYYPGVKTGKRVRVNVRHGTNAALLAGDASTFEGSTGGWSADTGTPTFVRFTSQSRSGSASLAVTSTAAGAYAVIGPAFPVAPTQGCTAGTWSRAASTGRAHECGINWYSSTDGTSGYISTSASSVDPTTVTTGWVNATVTDTAPTGANSGRVYAKWSSATGAGETQYLDDVSHPPIPRFDGHINDWPTKWTTSLYGPVQVTATDRFKRFGQLGELRSILEEEYLRDAVEVGSFSSVYYPLSEPAGSSSVTSATEHEQAQGFPVIIGAGQFVQGREAAIEFGSGTGPGTDELSAPIFAPATTTNGKYILADLIKEIGGGAISLECWFRVSGLGIVPDSAIINRTILTLSGKDRSQEDHVAFQIDNTGRLHGRKYRGGTLIYQIVSNSIKNDGETHHAVLTETLVGSTVTARMYINNQQVAGTPTYTVSGSNLPSYKRLVISGNSWTPGDLFTGTISHTAAYSSALSVARIADHYKAGKDGIVGERTDVRIGRLASYLGIPATERVFDVGDSTVGWQSTSGAQPINAMQDVEETENGVLFMSMESKLVFHKRSRRFNVTPFLTLDAAFAEQIGMNLEFPGDDFGLINDATATRPRNSEVRAVNRASIDEFGLYRHSTTILDDSDTRAQGVVDWIVNAYGEELTRAPNVTVDLYIMAQSNPTLAAKVLASEISHMLRLSNLPSQAPSITVDSFIEGWTESIDIAVWTISFNCSPAIVGNVWQLGVAGFSELGLTTKLAF